ncbi:BatA domain-containing protein [Rhodopirellula sp. JC639]|uniref:BatA domain-containing protein n=1 Tax=Stieleria mannarensis TaxID=2755585 RepID=UPI0016004069|nr:BatA domain-containing protein [Rhodopirellula sp. JC639]
MSFLRLGALWALPLVLIPIVIHLIHRRRHPSAPWAAMMFLRRASQTRRGPAKLRRWLILAVRTLVVAAVVGALARPLSSSRFGIAASRVVSGAPSIVVLDRSPSMQRRTASGLTYQAAALRRLSETLQTLGTQRVVLIDSVSLAPVELADVDALTDPSVTSGAASAADIPQMLRVAMQTIRDNDHAVADVWVCSDRQASDWRADAPLWTQIAAAAKGMGPGVRLHLLDVASDPRVNSSVTVTRQRLVDHDQGQELMLSILVQRDDDDAVQIPVRVTVGGVTSRFDVQVDGGRGELAEVRVPLPQSAGVVFGQVAIPADVNVADDDWFFVAKADQDRPIGLIAQSPCLALEVAADVLGTKVDTPNAELSGAGQGSRLAGREDSLRDAACWLWQGPLPVGEDARAARRFLQSGGSIVFFPPMDVDREREFQSIRWGQWSRDDVQQATFDQWELPIAASCSIDGQLVRVATIGQDQLWIGKLRVGDGAAWFCGADVIDGDSLFVTDGLVLYGLVAEALGASRLHVGGDQGFVAGIDDQRLKRQLGQNQTLDDAIVEPLLVEPLLVRGDTADAIPLGHAAGVFSVRASAESSTDVVAINRPVAESDRNPITESQLQSLLGNVRWNRVTLGDRQDGSGGGLVQEIWGAIWVLMILGMLCEAWLTLPTRTRGQS